MLLEELEELVLKGESDRLEFKKTTGQRTEAVKAICAFLNTVGGYVLFGVSDNGEIIGQEVKTKTFEDLQTELTRIEPPVFLDLETVAVRENKVVIVIRVPGKLGTFLYDHRPYIRLGPITKIMPREEYEKRISEKFHVQKRWENDFAPEWVTIKDLDEEAILETLQRAIKLGRMKKPQSIDTEFILRGLGLIDKGRLLNAAVALYGKSEVLFPSFPQLSLRLARFRGKNRLTGYQDNREYWGHAFDLLKRAEYFLLDHTPISSRIVPGKLVREDYPLYPPFATREAIANAICHRDYAFHGGAIAIAFYDDRLEIINPGVLHFDLTPEKLASPHESKPWNPIIANVFYRAGIIEKWGTGTLNIIDACKENQNPSPSWEIRSHSVVITFFPSTFFATGKNEEEFSSAFVLSDEKPLEMIVLDLLKEKPLSSREIAQELGHKQISGNLKRILGNLLMRGLISHTIPDKPNSRLQKYKIQDFIFKDSDEDTDSLEYLLLNLLEESPLSKAEIARKLGHKQISGRLKEILKVFLKKGIISYTIPEKRNSRLQKYYLSKP